MIKLTRTNNKNGMPLGMVEFAYGNDLNASMGNYPIYMWKMARLALYNSNSIFCK